jgi:hypothetical protein
MKAVHYALNVVAVERVKVPLNQRFFRRHMSCPHLRRRSDLAGSGFQHARGFGDMRCDGVHQWRRETVVRLKAELAQSAADGVLIRRVGATPR